VLQEGKDLQEHQDRLVLKVLQVPLDLQDHKDRQDYLAQ